MDSEPIQLNYLDDLEGFRRFVNWLHWAIAGVLLISALAIYVSSPKEPVRYLPLAGVLLSLLVSAGLTRHRPKRAVMVIVCSVWLMSSLAIVKFAGVHSASIIVYPFTIAMAGWVLGRRWLIALTSASGLLLLLLAWAEASGRFAPTPRATPLLVGCQIVAVLVIIAFLTYVARQGLMNSRNRALQLSSHLATQNAELAQQERELLVLMENVPAAVVSFDAHSRVRRCNRAYAALFGLEPQQVLGRAIEEFVPLSTLEQIGSKWQAALAGEAQHYRRSNHNPLTGAISWMDADVIPEFADGQVVGLFALVVDVAERVQAEQQIRALNAELEQRVEQRSAELAEAMQRLQQSRDELVRSQAKATLSAMVANVSHELNTPIGNSVLLAGTFQQMASELQRQLNDGQLRKSSLLKLCETLDQGSQMMQQNLGRAEALMRSFKQVAVDQVSERRRKIDLADTIHEVLQSLAPSLKKAKHRIELDIPAGIELDSLPGPLGQVLINLINNAYLHGFEGIDEGLLRICAHPEANGVLLTVEDNGVGIPPEALPELFKPFYSTKLGAGGSGLGLSIVENIVVKMLGGRLSVSSTPGRGTIFSITLPSVAPDFASEQPGVP